MYTGDGRRGFGYAERLMEHLTSHLTNHLTNTVIVIQ
jgi:hypothetical protein